MSLTRFAIEKNRITVVLLIVVLVSGIATFNSMPRSEDPGFIIRYAQIITVFPGAGPERVEQLITDKLEKAIKEMPELDFVMSESKTNVSVVVVKVRDEYKRMRPIWDSLRRKVDKVRPELPADIHGPTVNDEFGDVFGTIITLTGEGFDYVELKEIADEVRDELLRISEVAKVDIYGAQEERIFVEYNNARLAELSISPFQLSQFLESQNIIIPGGSVSTGNERLSLEPTGNFESLDEVKRTVIQLPGRTDLLYLEDVVSIYRDYIDPPTSIVSSTGKPALALAVSMREGGNLILLGQEVKETIKNLSTVYPYGIDFDFVSFQSDIVDAKVNEFVVNLMQAIAVVVLVMLISLGLRTGLIVATLIPSALISAILVMSILGIGLDQVSLASLIIALGMLVDNAIVMAESIMVQMREGKKPIDAAVDSAKELRIPLLTSSLTTAAAFLPFFLAESDVGEYTASIFVVVTITLICSWILALTVTPLLCVKYIRVKTKGKSQKHFGSKFYRIYRGGLTLVLRHRALFVAGSIIVFYGGMMLFSLVPNLFFPDKEDVSYQVELELPLGTTIERTQEVTGKVEDFIKSEFGINEERTEGVINWVAYIGQGGPRYTLAFTPEPQSSDYAFMLVNCTSTKEVRRQIPIVRKYCFDNFPDLRARVAVLQYGPPVDHPIAIRVSGRDQDTLFDIVDEIKAKLTVTEGTTQIGDDWGQRIKKLLVKVNQPRARAAGITNQDIAISLQAGLSGLELTQYREEDQIIPVVLRSVAADRQDLGKLETINVYSQISGRSIPLKQVADIEVVWQPSKILRRNRYKTVTVYSDILPGYTGVDVMRPITSWLEETSKSWHPGYDFDVAGETESSEEANKSIEDKMPIAGFIILILLVSQFNSLRKPLIIILTIPFGLVGVGIGLNLAGSYFGFMTLLGVVSLAGIVINNAIVLIERIKIEKDVNGLDHARAIIEAAQRRLRPILLTTATTVSGLLPLWFGGGAMFQPMAIAIIFGLLFATLLTLGVVPVFYSLFFGVSFKTFKY